MAAIDKSLYEKMTITSVSGEKTAHIKTGVISFNYYEDVFSPMITARMVVVNTGNTIIGEDGKVQSLYNGLPLRGGEKVEVKEEPFVTITQEDIEEDLKYRNDEGANLEVQAKHTDWEEEENEAEERMNIIGQNGNDGIHYEKEEYAADGYMESELPLEKPEQSKFIEEKEEIERIIKRALTQWEIKDLQESNITNTFGKPKKDDDDDLIIKY